MILLALKNDASRRGIKMKVGAGQTSTTHLLILAIVSVSCRHRPEWSVDDKWLLKQKYYEKPDYDAAIGNSKRMWWVIAKVKS